MKLELSAFCRYTTTLALSLALGAGCSATPPDGDDRIGSARAAVASLTERDEVTVGVCAAAAARCSADAPDAGGNACVRLSELCTELSERLSEVRSPAVGCWRGVEACLQSAPDGAGCPTPEQCEALGEDVEAERDPVVRCGERAQACLSRAAQVPESEAACDAIAASCERIAGGGDGEGELEDDEDDESDAGAAGRARGQAARAAAAAPGRGGAAESRD